MTSSEGPAPSALKRLLREPTIHFFLIGALLFLAHHFVAGDPRTIVVSPGVQADVARRFQDHNGRAPTPAEAEAAMGSWKRDEVLYREALRNGFDRDDATVRTVLIDKMKNRLALELPKREPSDEELTQWLAAHREVYETPLRYTLEWVVFPKTQPPAEQQRQKYEQALQSGAEPRRLGRPVFGASATVEEMKEKLDAALAERLPTLARGKWHPAESGGDLLLLRVTAVEGGLPAVKEIRPRLVADLLYAEREQGIQRATQAMAERYRFEEKR